MPGILIVVTHRRPTVRSLHGRMRAELDAAIRAADAEPDPALRLKKESGLTRLL
jgi:hypothetical protein